MKWTQVLVIVAAIILPPAELEFGIKLAAILLAGAWFIGVYKWAMKQWPAPADKYEGIV